MNNSLKTTTNNKLSQMARVLVPTLIIGIIIYQYVSNTVVNHKTVEEPSTTKVTSPRILPPQLSCLANKQCLDDKVEELIKSQATLELQRDALQYSSTYGSTYIYSAILIHKYTGDEKHIRRFLAEIDQGTHPHYTVTERISEQLKLAALLEDKQLIERYLQQAKKHLIEQNGQLSSSHLGIEPKWMVDASGVPDENWLALAQGDYKVASFVAGYVNEGVKISVNTGLERLKNYKKYLLNYRAQLKSILKEVVAQGLWPTWHEILQSDPKLFELVLRPVKGNEREPPLLPAEFVPWKTFQNRILAALHPHDISSEMVTYGRFAARDLAVKDFIEFLNKVTILNDEKKEEYAAYFVKQLIKNNRYSDANETLTLFMFKDDQKQKLTKRLSATVSDKPRFEENFTLADYKNYTEKDKIHGACQYLRDFVSDSTNYLLSSSHSFLAKKRIKERNNVFKRFGKDIEVSCQQIKKPCSAVYYLHKLSHYSESRPSIVKAMIQQVNKVKKTNAKALSCSIYFLSGQLPYVLKAKNQALFEDILATIEQKLTHTMDMDGYRGLSDEYQLYASGVADSLFMALQKKDESTIQLLLRLVKRDRLHSFLLENDFLYRLSIAEKIPDFDRKFSHVLFIIKALYKSKKEQQRHTTELLYRVVHDSNSSNRVDKLVSILSAYDKTLTNDLRYQVLYNLLDLMNLPQNTTHSHDHFDLLTQHVLNHKLNSISDNIKALERKEEYEQVEKFYGALQRSLANKNRPYGIEEIIKALQLSPTQPIIGNPADNLLISLLKAMIANKKTKAIERIKPIFSLSNRIYDNQIVSGIRDALYPHKSKPDAIYAFRLYQLRPDTTPSLTRTTSDSLRETLSRKPDGDSTVDIFCQLVKQQHTDKAKQLLLAKPMLYSQPCSLHLAVQIQSQPILDNAFERLSSSELVGALLASQP